MPIRVTVELLPSGDERKKKLLGVIDIVNDGTGDKEVGHYNVTLRRSGLVPLQERVEHYPRMGGWLPLAWRACQKLVAKFVTHHLGSS